jgi:hypothetical protein
MHTEYLSNLLISNDTSTSVAPAVLGVCFGVCVSFLKLLGNEIVDLDPFSPLPTAKNWARILRIVLPRTWISALSLFTLALLTAPPPSLLCTMCYLGFGLPDCVTRSTSSLTTVACLKGCCGDRRSDSTAWMHSVGKSLNAQVMEACVDPQIFTSIAVSCHFILDYCTNRKLLRSSGLRVNPLREGRQQPHQSLETVVVWGRQIGQRVRKYGILLFISRCQIVCVNLKNFMVVVFMVPVSMVFFSMCKFWVFYTYRYHFSRSHVSFFILQVYYFMVTCYHKMCNP